jgi:uncharacterized integral membrane protein
MQATPDKMRGTIDADQSCFEHIIFSPSVVVVCVSVAAVVYVANITKFETGAHASVSLYALLLLAFLLTSLTLTSLARLTWLPSLVGLSTRLATSYPTIHRGSTGREKQGQ